jgi:hypothetical protein
VKRQNQNQALTDFSEKMASRARGCIASSIRVPRLLDAAKSLKDESHSYLGPIRQTACQAKYPHANSQRRGTDFRS